MDTFTSLSPNRSRVVRHTAADTTAASSRCQCTHISTCSDAPRTLHAPELSATMQNDDEADAWPAQAPERQPQAAPTATRNSACNKITFATLIRGNAAFRSPIPSPNRQLMFDDDDDEQPVCVSAYIVIYHA